MTTVIPGYEYHQHRSSFNTWRMPSGDLILLCSSVRCEFLGYWQTKNSSAWIIKCITWLKDVITNKSPFKKKKRAVESFFHHLNVFWGGGCGPWTSFQGSCSESGLPQTQKLLELDQSLLGQCDFGALGNNRAARLFSLSSSMLGLFILRRLSSMNHRNGEMDWRWTVFALFLNFHFTYGSPSSYDLFQGSPYTGAVHRHRNR